MAKPIAAGASNRKARHNYPPLFMAGLVLLALLTVLPSALNLPQANPSETLEYAPIPPEDEAVDDPPPGNLSSLGLAASGSFGAGSGGTGEGFGGGGKPDLSGRGKNPSTKRCVGNPPRQAEDPLSPPCVAHFSGENFGATYSGVSAEEVRVLFYMWNGAGSYGPANSYFDLGVPPAAEEEPMFVRLLRAYQRHFNDRYQTYGRFVRFVVRFDGGPDSETPEARRADAASDYNRVHPFAVVNEVNKHAEAYVEQMTRRGVVVFLGNPAGGAAGSAFQAAAFYNRARPLLWSYIPSIEQMARLFVTYVCSKVVPFRVSFSGNGDHGQERRLGLLRVTDRTRPDKIALGLAIKRGIESCGGTFVAEGTIPRDADGSPGSNDSAAVENMATFSQRGVTTVIQAGGTDPYGGRNTHAAAALNYRPEWVLAGDLLNDANLTGQEGAGQEQSVWQHARAVSLYTRVDSVESQPCYQAARSADPTLTRGQIKVWGCIFYTDVRTLMTGIQVAGPRLNPRTLEQGYRAIPGVRSEDPTVPACFFEPNDFTCVKDAQAQWWDPTGRPPDNDGTGCWRMMEGGRRYLAGTWPSGDVEAQRNPAADRCNLQGLAVDADIGF